jgi:cell division septation protein DedD
VRVVPLALLLVALAVLGACASEEVNSEPDAAPVTVTETVEAGDTEEPTTEEAVEETTSEEAPPPPPEPELTAAQENAIESAQSYLDFGGFSRQGLIDQLTSEYGEGFKKKDAEFAVNYLDPNWKKEAVESAKSYLEFGSFSLQGLIEQLESPYGDQYTHAQAVHGAKKAYNE